MVTADEIRSSINAALISSTSKEKIENLSSVKEQLIHRRQGIPPSVVLELISEVTSPALQLDADQAVRHFVLQFIEDLCRTPGTTSSMMVNPLESLSMMLEDESQPDQVSRWALTTSAKIWKCCLYVLAKQIENVQTCKNLFTALWRVKSAGMALLASSPKRKDKSSRINAIKFVEVICLSLFNDLAAGGERSNKKQKITTTSNTSSSSSSLIAPQFESLRDAPARHPSLPSSPELIEESEEMLKILINLVKSESESIPIRVACSNSLTLIARMRPEARDSVVECFVNLVGNSNSNNFGFLQGLKTNVVLLLKSLIPDEKSLDSPFLVKLGLILKTLKAEEHLTRHLDPLKKKKYALDLEQEELKRKLKEYPPQTNRFPTEGLHLLPIETLSRLLVDNAGNVPDRPPPGHKSIHSSSILLGQTGIPIKLERFVNLVKAVESGRGLILPKALQEITVKEVSTYEALRQREMAFSRVIEAAIESGQNLISKSNSNTCSIVASRLACDFENINNTDGSEVGGGGGGTHDAELREKLIDDLLVKNLDQIQQQQQQQQQQQNNNSLIINEEVAALSALHIEFAADRIRKNDLIPIIKPLRYEEFLNKLVSKMILDGNRNSKRLSKILCDSPSLPQSTLNMIVNLCEQPELYKAYFGVIRELLISRPSCRDFLLKILLNYSTKTDLTTITQERRVDAVRLIANKLFKGLGVKWNEYIKRFAYQAFESLSLSLKDVCELQEECKQIAKKSIIVMKEEEEEIKSNLSIEEEKSEIISRIHLYVALCASDIRLLPGLFVLYSNLKLLKFNQETPLSNDEQQRISRIFDLLHSETDQLWVKISIDISSPIKSIPLLQDFSIGSEELILRAVTIFARKDPDSSLLPISQLHPLNDPTRLIVQEDIRFIIPFIGSLEKEEALSALIRIATSSTNVKEDIKKSVENIMNGTSGRTIDSSELLITLANMQTEEIILVQATDAVLDQKIITTERIMRKVFQELSEQETYPVVLLRIIIKAYLYLPSLKMDAIQVLHKLVDRQVWNNAKLWEGFQYLTKKLLPESFDLILRLPDEIFKEFVHTMEAQQKNFKDLLRNLAQMQNQQQHMEQEEMEDQEGGGQDDNNEELGKKKKEIIEISSFKKEYFGLL